jgi:hypothetical protein
MSLIIADTEKYCYEVNGWKVDSAIPFTELWPCQTNSQSAVDVTIAYGKVAEKLEGAVARGIGFQIKPDHYILSIEGLGRFRASYGQYITVDPIAGVEEDMLKPFILGSVFGALAHQRRLLPIHASAVQFGESALLFTGPSGAGKSTAAVSFLLKECSIISDDVSVVHFGEHKEPIIHPGMARLKICEDLVSDIPQAVSLNRISKLHDKLFLPLKPDSKPKTNPVTHVFHLSKGSQEESGIRELEGISKYRAISTNIFRQKLIDGLGVRKTNFAQVADFVERVKVFEVTRPANTREKFKLFDNIERVLN